jgi:hypothetical protein
LLTLIEAGIGRSTTTDGGAAVVAYSGGGGDVPVRLELESYSERADEHHHDEAKLAVKKMALEAHRSP